MPSQSVKLEREKRRSAREERLWGLVTDPAVKRLLLLSLIVAYSTYVTRSKTNAGPIQSALAMTLPTIGIPLIAADAGVKDWRALLAFGGVAGGLTALSAEAGLRDVGRSMLDSVTWEIPSTDIPAASLAGPLPMLAWLQERL